MNPKNFHLSHGLTLMITPKHKMLCFNPNDNDRAAREMWLAHSEERLKQNIALRLFTNKKTLFGYPMEYHTFGDDEFPDIKDIKFGPPLI